MKAILVILLGISLITLGSIILFSKSGRARIFRDYEPGSYWTFHIRGVLPAAALQMLMGSVFILTGVLSIADIDSDIAINIIIILGAISIAISPFLFTTMYFSWPRRFLMPQVRDLEPEWILPWSWWAKEQKRIQQHESNPHPTQEDS